MAIVNSVLLGDTFQVDEHLSIPKYLQVANFILKEIEKGRLKKNDILPSINELSRAFDLCPGYSYKKLPLFEESRNHKLSPR